MNEYAVTPPATMTAMMINAITSGVVSTLLVPPLLPVSPSSKPIGSKAAPIGTMRYTGL